MNYLAHLFLAQDDVNLLVGNFIADHIKGNKIDRFSAEVQRGIMMHRAIDTFTDSHEVVMKSKSRLHPIYHKYAGVLIDLYYDHFLAKNWSTYSPLALESFTTTVYKLLNAKRAAMPERSKAILTYMSQQNWLLHYRDIDGMKKAFRGVAARAKFQSQMENAHVELIQDFHLYEQEFFIFFKELFEYSAFWKEQNKH